MKAIQCRYEEAVSTALVSEQWGHELQTHVVSCSVCQSIIDVRHWLAMLAKTPEPESTLPGARYVWWRAQLLRRQAIREEAIRPIMFAQIVTYLLLSLGLGLGFVRLWPQIEVGILDFSNQLLSWSFFAAESTSLLYLAIGLFCMNAILTLHLIIAENKLKK